MVRPHGWKFGWIGIDQRRCKFGHSFDLHVAVLEQPLDGMDRPRSDPGVAGCVRSKQPRGAAAMTVVTIGLDIAKSIFQVHGVDDVAKTGVVWGAPICCLSSRSSRHV